jgi:tetratricopeptide (TPR) repeat protein
MAKRKGKPRRNPAERVDLSLLRETLFGEPPIMKERPSRRRRWLSPREQAEELMDQAVDEPIFAEELLRKALDIDPDCAEAWSMLADLAETPEQSLQCSDEAIAAARRELGEDTFRDSHGHFWLDHDTRPYMSLLLEKVERLLDLGRVADAAPLLEEMLRLNPNDNQGARELLAKCLLELRDHAGLEKLLAAYPDDGLLGMCFSNALLAFRQEGSGARANQLLSKALSMNRHVPAYLLSSRPIPREFPELIACGEEDEAALYAASFLLAWKESPGALSWLREHADVPEPAKPRSSPRRSAQAMRQLESLPQSAACWQVDVRSLDPSGKKSSSSGWVWIVLDDRGQPLGLEPLERFPGKEGAWQRLESLMRLPKEGEPARPKRVQFCDPRLLARCEPKLRKLGIAVELREEFPLLDRVFAMYQQTSIEPPLDAEPLQVEQLKQLPKLDEVWQVDVRRAPVWVGGKHGPSRPWMILVTDRTGDYALRHDILESEATGSQIAEQVRRAMVQPAIGEPHRPGVVETSSASHELRELLAALEIPLAIRDDLDHLNFVLDCLATDLNEQNGLPALLSAPEMTTELVGDFFAAAADYFRQKPWRRVPGDTVIKIECRDIKDGPWYGVVMGQMGQTLGLATYDDLSELRNLMVRGQDDAEARTESGLTMLYGEAFEIAVRDLVAAERHGWPVASPEAYPLAVRLEGGQIRQPRPEELELLTACLRRVPDYLERRDEEWTAVAGTRRNLRLRLSIVDA